MRTLAKACGMTAVAGLLAAGAAMAADVSSLKDFVLNLKGRWGGVGTVKFLNGEELAVKCVATYFTNGEGTKLKQSFRCKSERFDIDFQGLGAVEGDTLAGTWKERKYEVEGEFVGTFADNTMEIRARSRFASALIQVSSAPCVQQVVIEPEDAERMGVASITGVMKKC